MTFRTIQRTANVLDCKYKCKSLTPPCFMIIQKPGPEFPLLKNEIQSLKFTDLFCWHQYVVWVIFLRKDWCTHYANNWIMGKEDYLEIFKQLLMTLVRGLKFVSRWVNRTWTEQKTYRLNWKGMSEKRGPQSRQSYSRRNEQKFQLSIVGSLWKATTSSRVRFTQIKGNATK